MSFIWTDKQNGIDVANANDINSIAHAVMNVETEVNSKLDSKVDKISGKDLSTNDYTDEDKAKVDKIIHVSISDLQANPLLLEELDTGTTAIINLETYDNCVAFLNKIKTTGFPDGNDTSYDYLAHSEGADEDGQIIRMYVSTDRRGYQSSESGYYSEKHFYLILPNNICYFWIYNYNRMFSGETNKNRGELISASIGAKNSFLDLLYPYTENTGVVLNDLVENSARGENALAINSGNEANGDCSFAGGTHAHAIGDYSFVWGVNCYASSDDCVTIGQQNMLLGPDNYAFGMNMGVIGEQNYSFGNGNNLGSNEITGTPAIDTYVIGKANEVYGNDNYVIGNNNKVDTTSGVFAMGRDLTVEAIDSVTLGANNTNQGKNNVIIGTSVHTYGGDEMINIGVNNKTYNSSNSAIIGNNIDIKEISNVFAIGKNLELVDYTGAQPKHELILLGNNNRTTTPEDYMLILGNGCNKDYDMLTIDNSGNIKILCAGEDEPVCINDRIHFDTAPTENSKRAVTSGGVYEALQNALGDIETALDGIIALENQLIGEVEA